jgi:hypothetical protein
MVRHDRQEQGVVPSQAKAIIKCLAQSGIPRHASFYENSLLFFAETLLDVPLVPQDIRR